MPNKKNKVAIVTGGSRGIGFNIAQILAKEKYNVVICSRNKKELKEAKLNLELYVIFIQLVLMKFWI